MTFQRFWQKSGLLETFNQDSTCDLMLTVTNFTNLSQYFLNWLIFKKFTGRNSFLLLDNTTSACDTHSLQQSWNNRDEALVDVQGEDEELFLDHAGLEYPWVQIYFCVQKLIAFDSTFNLLFCYFQPTYMSLLGSDSDLYVNFTPKKSRLKQLAFWEQLGEAIWG